MCNGDKHQRKALLTLLLSCLLSWLYTVGSIIQTEGNARIWLEFLIFWILSIFTNMTWGNIPTCVIKYSQTHRCQPSDLKIQEFHKKKTGVIFYNVIDISKWLPVLFLDVRNHTGAYYYTPHSCVCNQGTKCAVSCDSWKPLIALGTLFGILVYCCT